MSFHPDILREKLVILDRYLADLHTHGDSISFAWSIGPHFDPFDNPIEPMWDEMTGGYRNPYRVALLRRIREAGARVVSSTNDTVTLSLTAPVNPSTVYLIKP